MTTPSPLTGEELAKIRKPICECGRTNSCGDPNGCKFPELTLEQIARKRATQVTVLEIRQMQTALLATIDQLRNAVVEECANKVRYDCSAYNGDGYAEYNPLNDPCECEYCADRWRQSALSSSPRP